MLNEANESRSQSDSTISALQARLDEQIMRRSFADRLAHVMEKGRQLLHGYKKGTSVLYPSEEAINTWTLNEVNPILRELGMTYIARFNSAPETVNEISLVGIPVNIIVEYMWLASRI